MLLIRIVAFCIFILLLVYVCRLVLNGKLLLKYSLLWLMLCACALLCVFFPELVFRAAHGLQFINASNFIFLAAILALYLIALSLSLAVSRHVLAIKNLTQRISILENEICKQKINDLN